MYTLPKIWQQRVPKYWNKYMPTDYPTSSSEFSLTFSDDADKTAVANFEETLGTEDSPVAEVVGEDNFVSNYFGTYEVTGEAGERTLLSPERIETEDDILAFHYNADSEAWEQIEDASLEAGYVWGTVESFSPIAIISVKKDIVTAEPDFAAGKWIIANGNPIRVFTDKEDGDKIKIMNLSSGKAIELGDATVVCGGSIDGSKVSTTNVSVVGIENENLGFYAGSYCWDNEDEEITTTNDVANINVVDSKVRAITGAGGRVRCYELNINVSNSSAKSHIACGESWNTKAKKDANKTGKDLGFGSTMWTKVVNMTITNGSYTQLLFTGGNTGYTYTDFTNLVIRDSKVDYVILGGSNGRVRATSADISGLEGNFFQTINRGTVDSAIAKIDKSVIPNLYVFGDDTDKTVTGTVNFVAIDINKGTYGIKAGVNGGEPVTDVSPVKYVKYSRNAEVTVSDEDKALLGDKLIVK